MRGLYAITDTANHSTEIMLTKTEEILRAGAKILQYRNKQSDKNTRISEAEQIVGLCKQYSVPLIINDDIALTIQAGADGVHLGRNDLSITEARKKLGNNMVIGYSCYNDLDRASYAVNAGADYIAFGAFYSSPSKPDAVRATPDIIQKAKQQFNLPVVAIGGITPENGQTLIDAGADMLAVISGLYASETSFQSASQYVNLFQIRL
ncbi:MAG: thiamine-phosphate pyrophosphorylase [Gammaproteobacteria bacterium]|jgi:thiamine-phosphate pyrophosphorylase